MQLEDLNSSVIFHPSEFVDACMLLAVNIDTPAENNKTFSRNLHHYKEFCPKLFNEFVESKKPLKKRSLDERAYLEQKRLEDFEANIAAADAQFWGELIFYLLIQKRAYFCCCQE